MSNVSTDERERETKKRERRRVNLTQSVISEGSPAFFGLEDEIRVMGDPYKTRSSTMDWLKLVDLCADNIGEWFNRKFYYSTPDLAPRSNSYTSVASIVNNGGASENKDQHIKQLAARVKELCEVYRIEFEAAYTKHLAKSDDPTKGEVMHAVFVRAVPKSGEAKAKPADVLATSNSVDDRRYMALDRRPGPAQHGTEV